MPPKQIINTPPKESPNALLTRQELHDTAVERVHLISKEFTDAFNFLRNYPKSVTVFGGSHFTENDLEYVQARSLTARISTELKYSVVTGGGPGIMEAANRGSFDVGGESIGLTIELSHHQIQNQYLTKNLDFYYFFSRKVCLAFSAEAYVFFPGGYGTFDEFFEILTLVQTRKIEKVPIILVGSGFWKPFDDIIRQQMLGKKTIDPEDADLYVITDNEDSVIDMIRNAPVRNGIRFEHKLAGAKPEF